METHKPLLKDTDGEDIDEHMYKLMIGSLMYLTSSRPDIMFVVNLNWAFGILRIHLFDLVAYTDSDYTGASLDRKSTTGGCQFLGCILISWQCKKQTVVVNFTTEAEYIAAFNCCRQRIIHKGWLEWNAKATKDGIGVKTSNSRVNAAGHYLVLLENVDFVEIVDFMNANPIRYALTVSPTIYVSCIEQFWSTAKIKTVNNETHIHAKVEGKTIVISESSVRKDLQFDNEDGTDKTNITRKPSKTSNHGHEERKSTKEAKDSKPKPRKVNLQKCHVEERKAQGLMKFTLSVLSKEAQSSNHTDATLAIRVSYHLIQRPSITLQSL
ncbi:hypothetical protein Tco_0080367 [Tanacetum coccineum]